MPGGDYRDALRERAGWVPEAGPLLDADGERVGEHRGTAGLHGRPAPGARRRARRAALRQPDRSADEHDHARAARGPRDDHASSSSGRASSPATRRAAATPFRAEIRIRHRATPIPATVRPATRERAGSRRALAGRDRHAGLGRGAGPGGRALRRRRRPRRRADRAAVPPRRPIARDGPPDEVAALVGSPREHRTGARSWRVLVGIFHAALYVLIRGNAGGRLPIIVRRRDPRGVGRRRARRPARVRRADDRRLPPARRRSIVAWVGIGISSAVAILGPSMRKA